MTKQDFLAKVPYFTYFPFIGWFFPVILRKDDELLIFHGKQAFLLAAYNAVTCSSIYLLSGIIDTPVVKLGLVVLIYIHYVVYLMLGIAGTFAIRKGEMKALPIVSRYTDKFEL